MISNNLNIMYHVLHNLLLITMNFGTIFNFKLIINLVVLVVSCSHVYIMYYFGRSLPILWLVWSTGLHDEFMFLISLGTLKGFFMRKYWLIKMNIQSTYTLALVPVDFLVQISCPCQCQNSDYRGVQYEGGKLLYCLVCTKSTVDATVEKQALL